MLEADRKVDCSDGGQVSEGRDCDLCAVRPVWETWDAGRDVLGGVDRQDGAPGRGRRAFSNLTEHFLSTAATLVVVAQLSHAHVRAVLVGTFEALCAVILWGVGIALLFRPTATDLPLSLVLVNPIQTVHFTITEPRYR